MDEIRIVVVGKAETAGSKRAYYDQKSKKVRVVDDNAKSRPWKTQVAQAAVEQWGGDLLDCALVLECHFYQPRPKGHFGTGKNAGLVKPSATYQPITAPDVLKLSRGVEDALQGVVYRNDAQIVEEHLYKHYGEPQRVEIVIKPTPVQVVGDLRPEPPFEQQVLS